MSAAALEAARSECPICQTQWPEHHPNCAHANAVKRAYDAENEVARLRLALFSIDVALTTVDGDNLPRGEAPKRAARVIARAALEGKDA